MENKFNNLNFKKNQFCLRLKDINYQYMHRLAIKPKAK